MQMNPLKKWIDVDNLLSLFREQSRVAWKSYLMKSICRKCTLRAKRTKNIVINRR